MRIISDNEYREFRRAVEQLSPSNKEEGYVQLVSEL
jgi:hypothetical protein